MMRDSQLCFRNSDAKSPEYEECEHDGPKVTSTHVGDTTQDDHGDLRWLMISNKAQRSHTSKEPQITRSLLEVRSEPKVKNQKLRATRLQEC